MKIGELAQRSGLSTHTLRYYERIGLLPKSRRLDSRHRDYDESILTWISLLGRLKTTGMPIRQMLVYAALVEAGDGTVAERHDLLVAHRKRVREQIADLQACLAVLDTKIAGYAGACERTTHDRSKHSANAAAGC
jgi:DNA-binding transcriptional MerR regulator